MRLKWDDIDYWIFVHILKESVAALSQLSKMRKQLDKKQEDLGLTDGEDTNKTDVAGNATTNGNRRNSIWDGLAEL